MHTFDLSVGEISKIEGKASLDITVKDDKIETLKFAITEFKRFYTQALRGKDVAAVPQLTARVCGTCSNAHLLCAIKAVEHGLNIIPSEQTKKLRKLLNYGLIIRDHALHLYFFALPDILKIDSLLELDENDQNQHQMLHDAFDLKRAGNMLGKIIGGRSVHAPYPTIGGFVKLPDPQQIPDLIKQLEAARDAAKRTISLFTNCAFTLNHQPKYVALKNGSFDFLEGPITTGDNQFMSAEAYGNYLKHVIIPHSHASGWQLQSDVIMVGALARINLIKDALNERTKNDAATTLSLFPSNNLYHNNLAQAIEILHAIDASIEILTNLCLKSEPPQPITRKKGVGVAAIEAPRGLLFYKLGIDDEGKITTVQIVVPTGQNQIGIEKNIYNYLSANLSEDKNHLIANIEQIIRAYDPCMSCASHFLKVFWKTRS